MENIIIHVYIIIRTYIHNMHINYIYCIKNLQLQMMITRAGQWYDSIVYTSIAVMIVLLSC